MRLTLLILALGLLLGSPAAAQTVPKAVFEDPAPDARFPARMEVIHVPSDGVNINGVVAGHSMGGWVTAETLAHDTGVLGGAIISAADMGGFGSPGRTNRAAIAGFMDDNREALTGATGESMADEAIAHAQEWSFATLAPKLVHKRLLVLYSNDFVAPNDIALIAAIKAAGGTEVQSAHEPTDHSWSDHRIALESLVINWLQSLPAKP